MSHYPHLSASIHPILSQSKEQRIHFIRTPKWIGYTAANNVLIQLQTVISQPPKSRMRNSLIISGTNNGKTTIIEKFKRMNPPNDDILNEDQISVPVVAIQAPPAADESRLYNNILDSLNSIYNPKEDIASKQVRVVNLLRKIGTRVLIIDELHNILCDRLPKQQQFLNVLKYLGNELKIPLVGVGTKDALRAIQSNDQLENRFEPIVLPKWKLNRDFLKLLASFEALTPLPSPSNLVDNELAPKLHMLCEGSIGELSTLLELAACKAIEHDEKKLTKKLFDSLSYSSPSMRRKLAESDG